jgi:hypothetical protein
MSNKKIPNIENVKCQKCRTGKNVKQKNVEHRKCQTGKLATYVRMIASLYI